MRVCHGDARRLPIEDESVHLVVTSPPFNCRVNYDGYDDWLSWDEYWHGLIEASLRECFRVLVRGGRTALNLANVIRQDVPEGRPGLSTTVAGGGSLPDHMARRGP